MAAAERAERVFLLSPASTTGKRARILLRPEADFELARRLRAGGAELGEVFTFLSGLYFRGKLTYARAFGRPASGVAGGLVITSDRGLVPPETRVRADDLHALAGVPIDPAEPRYREPLEATVRELLARCGPACEFVLLGSVASPKYVEVLEPMLGDRLRFPGTFVGRGDMSRGGLLLRSVDAGIELEYVAVRGAERRGSRPPRLGPRR